MTTFILDTMAYSELTRWVIGAGVLQATLIIGVLLRVAHLV